MTSSLNLTDQAQLAPLFLKPSNPTEPRSTCFSQHPISTKFQVFSALLSNSQLAFNCPPPKCRFRPALFLLSPYKPEDYPHAEQYYKTAISLPMYAGLTDSQQNFVISEIKKYFGKK
jgi:dTDP-4-amino-4,6-dideoxygalactose transaminase